MRTTTLLKALLGMQHLRVTGFAVEAGALVIEVCPAWRTPRCSGVSADRATTTRGRRGAGGISISAGCASISGMGCGGWPAAHVAWEAVPWCAVTTARFTTRFEEAVGFLSKALDDTRRTEWRRLRGIDKEEAKGVKGLRWPLLKNPWHLTPSQTRRLSTLPRDNGRLYRAYLLKETFADILSRRQPNVVKAKLREWLS